MSYRSRIEGRTQQGERRLAIAFRAVSILGVLCIAAAGLAFAFSLAAPPSVAHGSVTASEATNTGLVGATQLLGTYQLGQMLVPNAMWLNEGTTPPVDKAFVSTLDVAVRAAAPKVSAAAAAAAANAAAVRSTLGVASAGGSVAGVAKSQSRGTITIETFGYSFGGAPGGSKFVADVRNIPVDGFNFQQSENGLMPSVRDRVMSVPEAQTWLAVMRDRWKPALSDGDKVSIGCSRGHHRSVALGVLFADDLRAAGYTVNLVHRDIYKTW